MNVAKRGVEPVARRPADLGGDDLDFLPGFQRGVERHQLAADLGPAAAVAEVGMHPVGEIDRRRPGRQIDHLAVRRDYVDRLVERLLLVVLYPVRAVGDFVLPGQQLAQPGDLLVVVVLGAALGAFLVAPVGGDAEFGVLVHVPGADLDFQAAPVRAAHGGVQRAIVIALGIRDVVVEFLGNRQPQVVHDAERGIAVLQVIDDDAQGAHVVNLGELDAFLAHLVPDAVDVLRPAVDFGILDAGRFQFLAHLGDRIDDELLSLAALFVEQLGQFLVGVRMDEAEGQILQLPLQFPDTEPVGQRRIEFQRFARDLDAQIVRVGGVETQGLRPAGQAQQHDADVLDHGEQHLAQHFDLRLHLGRIDLAGLDVGGDETLGDRAQLVQPRNAMDQMRRRLAETLLDLRDAVFLMGRNGKQHGGHPRFDVELEASDDDRHAQRVRPDTLAATQRLVAIDLPGVLDGGLEAVGLGNGKPFAQRGEKLLEVARGGDGMNDGNHGRNYSQVHGRPFDWQSASPPWGLPSAARRRASGIIDGPCQNFSPTPT